MVVWASHWGGFLLQGTGYRPTGFSSRGAVLVALQHVGSFQTRDSTDVPCIARQILICTTGEVPDRAIFCQADFSFPFLFQVHLSGLLECSLLDNPDQSPYLFLNLNQLP